MSPRPRPTISFTDNWMKELDSKVAGSSKDTQRIQPKPKTQLSCTVRPVGGQESTKEIEKDILFGYEDIKHSTRTRRPVDGSKSIQYTARCDPWVDKNPPRKSRKISCLVTRTSSTQQERGDPWMDQNPSNIACRCLKKIEEEDQTKTVRPVGGQESTQVEELDIDFRVPGFVTCSCERS